MIYATKERANEVAAALNAVPGYAPAKAVLTAEGWTVIRSYYHGRREREEAEVDHAVRACGYRHQWPGRVQGTRVRGYAAEPHRVRVLQFPRGSRQTRWHDGAQ